MTTVIGVRFRTAGKIYYFDPGEEVISRGMSVIVETARGQELGMVMLPNTEVEDEKVVQPLKPVLRVATTEDFDVIRENKKKEKEAFSICQEKIREHQLEMKLIDVEYTFDNNKILFYFTADGRIDFRDLVKDLAYIFKTRIELRQIGVRDETKILGGYGICGRSLCCHSYLSDFIPVSIKMAKEQNLSLNPTKISGVCGRLMCCLKNEEATYEYLNSQLPKIGEMVTIPNEGVEGTVSGLSVLSQKVKVMIRKDNDEVEVNEYPVYDLDFGPDRKPPIPIAASFLPAEDVKEEETTSNSRERRNQEGGKGENRSRSGGRRGRDSSKEEGSGRHRNSQNDRQERGHGRTERNENRAERNENRAERNENRAERNENRAERNENRAERAENRGERNENRAERGENRGERNENRAERGENRGERNENRAERNDRRENHRSRREAGNAPRKDAAQKPRKEAADSSKEEGKKEGGRQGNHSSRRRRYSRKSNASQ